MVIQNLRKLGLSLKGLPKLTPTHILPLPEKGYWDNQTPSGQNKLGPSEDRALVRAITYQECMLWQINGEER